MPDPKIEEFTRAFELQPRFLRQMQEYLRTTVQPQLDERERLLDENGALRYENAALREELVALKAKKPQKEHAA